MITLIEILFLVILIQQIFKTPIGQKIGNFLPTPFWIYFIPIVLSTLKLLPQESPTYDAIGLHVLPAALILMLIGTPVTALIKLGPKASLAMTLTSLTMIVATFISFAVMVKFLPLESFRGAGALLATWVGGSANMLAVKELVSLSDASFAPLVIVDTILSYSWMALLILGVSYQQKYDSGFQKDIESLKSPLGGQTKSSATPSLQTKLIRIAINLLFSFALTEIMISVGKIVNQHSSFLPAKGWTILFASTATIFLAMTPLNKLESWGSTKLGSFLLYVVLATIGSKTNLMAAKDAPMFIVFGVILLIIHGVMLLSLGRVFKIPLFLLSTASQANVGGSISAPIVAEIYKPGTAQIGVIMGVIGNVIGTYVGLFGTWVCHLIEKALR